MAGQFVNENSRQVVDSAVLVPAPDGLDEAMPLAGPLHFEHLLGQRLGWPEQDLADVVFGLDPIIAGFLGMPLRPHRPVAQAPTIRIVDRDREPEAAIANIGLQPLDAVKLGVAATLWGL